MSDPRVVQVRPAGDQHQVVSVDGGAFRYRRSPCGGCPWVVANTGQFPPEAFLHSAETAYDMSTRSFACHESSTMDQDTLVVDRDPLVCAGFLLRGAAHNLAVRMASSTGKLHWDQVHDDGRELHRDYRAMAEANDCDPDDHELRLCREGVMFDE